MGNLGNTARKLEKLLVAVPAEQKQGGLLSDLLPDEERSRYREFEATFRERVDQGGQWPFKQLTNEELAELKRWGIRMKEREQEQ